MITYQVDNVNNYYNNEYDNYNIVGMYGSIFEPTNG